MELCAATGAAAFFGVTTLAHVWWLLFYIFSGDLNSTVYRVLNMLDFVLMFVTFAGMLLAMLQDRRRKVWPALAAVIPFVLIGATYMVTSISLLEQISAGYLLLLGLIFTGYMIFAIRQYGRWLNDNYADLENKRVWLFQTVSLVCMLLFMLYVLATDMVFIWLVHIIELVIVALLLWRVESLPLLELPAQPQAQQHTAAPSPSAWARASRPGCRVRANNFFPHTPPRFQKGVSAFFCHSIGSLRG